MSTLDEQKGRPLTRRELRELRAKGGEAAVREAVSASAQVGDVPTTSTAPHVVANSSADHVDEHPLTRRELRRLRTNEVPIIPEGGADAPAPDEGVTEVDPPVEQADDARSTDGASADAATSEPTRDDVDDDTTNEAASGDTGFEWPEVDESFRGDPVDPRSDDPRVGSAPSTGEESVVTVIDPHGDVVDAPEPEALSAARDEADGGNGIPRLAPTFGAGVSSSSGSTGAKSFDDLMENYTPTSPSSIIMTSSHRLPEGLGSTGAAKGTTDGREADAVLIDGEIPAHSSPTPIAASDAISTQKNARDVIRPPSPERGRSLVFTLGITAGILGIAAVATLATLYFTGVFNQ